MIMEIKEKKVCLSDKKEKIPAPEINLSAGIKKWSNGLSLTGAIIGFI